MARTATGPERTAIAGDHDVYARLSLKNASGTWKNASTDFGANDFFTGATLEEDIDSNSMILTATLLRDNGLLASLSPLRSDSTLNVDDVPVYAPMLDVARQWKVEVAVIAHGAALVGGDWKEIGAGTYDIINIDDPSPVIQIVGRDWGATLLDMWIDVERTYSLASSDSMETVIQSMLDDNLGVAAITLYTPTSPSFVMNKWDQQPMSLMHAINEVAAKAGFVVKYRYDAANVLRLTLHAPNRAAAPGAEVWSLGPSEYVALPVARLDLSGVRNRIVTRYFSDLTSSVQTLTTSNATSIARYGGPHGIARKIEIDLSPDTNIRTAARAGAFNAAVLSDLDTPSMEQEFEAPGFWIAQLGDYGKFLLNGVHYNADQYGGVVHIQHTLMNGTLRTVLSVRGQPAGRYRTWLTIGAGPEPEPAGPPAAKILRSSPSNRQLETVSLDGVLGADATGPLQWRYKLGVAAYTGYVSTALPQSLTVIRAPYYATPLVLELLQVDGQTATASYSVPSRVDESASGSREDSRRGGVGGVPVRAALFHGVPVYNEAGDTPLIDTGLGRVGTGLFGPTGTHGFTVIERGGGKGDGGFTDNVGALVSTAKDSRTALINAHFRYGTDGADGVLETAAKNFVHPTYVDATRRPIIMRNTTLGRDVGANDIDVGQERARTALNSGFRLITGATAAATAADGYAPMVSARGAAKQGTTARGGATEDEARGGRGGVPVRAVLFNTHPVYNDTGDTALIDPTTKQILPGLAIGPNVRGDSSVVFGGATRFSPNRHNEINASALHNTAATFGVSYENIPEIRVLGSIWTLPGASSTVDRKIEFKAESVSVAGYTPRAVSSTGSSTAAQTENPSTTINGTTAASQTISSSTGKVYWNLANANATSTTYTVKFDVDTTDASSGQWTVKLWKNTGTADDTNWSLVDSRSYDFNVSVTNETLQYTGAMAVNYDFKLTVSKTGGAGAFQCTVTAYACTYDKVTAGTETSLTPTGSALMVQAVEKS